MMALPLPRLRSPRRQNRSPQPNPFSPTLRTMVECAGLLAQNWDEKRVLLSGRPPRASAPSRQTALIAKYPQFRADNSRKLHRNRRMDGNNEPASVIKNNGLAVCNYVRHHRICVNRAGILRLPGKPTGWTFLFKFYLVGLETNLIWSVDDNPFGWC